MEPLAKVRLFAGAVEEPVLDDPTLQALLDDARVPDTFGRYISDPEYEVTYDVNRAIAAAWTVKAAKVAAGYNFTVENKSFNRSEMYDHFINQARMFAAKAYPTSIGFSVPASDWMPIGNINDPYDPAGDYWEP